MSLGFLLILAAVAAPTPEETAFSATASEMAGPCSSKIESKAGEDPPPACSAAIALARTSKEKATLYFAWAYSLNAAGAAIQALPNLDKAVELAPNFRNARHERAFTLNGLGFYERALTDANRDVALEPRSFDAYSERAFARQHLADFEGALADRLKVVELAGANSDSENAVIAALIWLGRYDQALARLAAAPIAVDAKLRAEIDRRLKFRPDTGESKRCALDQEIKGRPRAAKMVDDCTWAFDHESDRTKRADYLTVRRTAAMVASQDMAANLADLQIAAALDPNDPQRHINLGYGYLSISHSWAARNEFEIALASSGLSKRDKAWALAGRGTARANLDDSQGAFADAKASFELEPSEANLILTGNLSFARGDKDEAKVFWMSAYHLGARDDSLIASLKSVGVDHPESQPK